MSTSGNTIMFFPLILIIGFFTVQPKFLKAFEKLLPWSVVMLHKSNRAFVTNFTHESIKAVIFTCETEFLLKKNNSFHFLLIPRSMKRSAEFAPTLGRSSPKSSIP